MRPETMYAYLAEAHRQDLLREARQDALAAAARSDKRGKWSTALLLASDLLFAAGHRFRPRPAERPLFYVHRVAAGDITVVRPFDDRYSRHVACPET